MLSHPKIVSVNLDEDTVTIPKDLSFPLIPPRAVKKIKLTLAKFGLHNRNLKRNSINLRKYIINF